MFTTENMQVSLQMPKIASRYDFLIKNILSGIRWSSCCCFLFLNLHWACASELEYKQILSDLSQPDREILEDFFKAMLANSEGGYVLYGNKPICFEAILLGDYDPLGNRHHRMYNLLNCGISTWEKVGLPKASQKFFLHVYQKENLSDGWTHILLINRSAYYRVVNQNIVLFKYVLGPQLTPEALLEQLTNPSTDFFTVLKNDKVLVGILLGFGTNNALFVNRKELLLESQEEHLQKDPTVSFGYSSLEQESDDLEQKIVSSSYRLEKYLPQLYFGNVRSDDKDLNNSAELINDYENTQKRIQKILNSDFLLENVLERFYE